MLTAQYRLRTAGYKETGVAEESGIIAKIGFKILQKKSTAVKFQDTLSMPGAISGTQLFDWDGEVITGYEVIQPDVLSLGDEPYETPGTDIPISSTPSVTPSPEVSLQKILQKWSLNLCWIMQQEKQRRQ